VISVKQTFRLLFIINTTTFLETTTSYNTGQCYIY